MSKPAPRNLLAIIGPGLLIAATGVGANDLAGGAFAGSKLGVAILWAVILGAFIKFVITEGLARWQLATGQTLLEGAFLRLGKPAQYFFIFYFLIWTFGVGSSLISACGVATYALFPVFDDPEQAKIIFGVAHSIAGLLLVLLGSYRLFEVSMSICVGIMCLLVIVTAALVGPDWAAVAKGLVTPTIPTYIENGSDQSITWTLALMGGVGGTLTVLSYGYWIREEGREGTGALKICRLDLGAAYFVTALFGLAVVIIASESDLERQASAVIVVTLGQELGNTIGHVGRLVFLVGAWAAMFSSLVGVWQSVPYMFADYWNITRKNADPENFTPHPVSIEGKPYRAYLFVIAFIPMLGLLYDFELVQKLQSAFGALVMPIVAFTLLLMNGKKKWVGEQYANRPVTVITLVGVLAFFGYIGGPKLWESIMSLFGG